MVMHLDADPRRDRILRAALRLCLERTPESVTIQQIRGLSGASTGSIYHHFRDKQGLFFELFLAANRNYQEIVLSALPAQGPPRSLVRAMVRAHIDWMLDNVGLARFVHVARRSELIRVDEPDIKAQHRSFVRTVYEHLDPWVRTGQLRAVPDDLAMAIVMGPTDHYTSEWLMGRTLTEPDQAFELLANAAWDALRIVPEA
ncbi:MAG: TetR/AcrR family transcriptional regulator [Myxococcota bacterium]